VRGAQDLLRVVWVAQGPEQHQSAVPLEQQEQNEHKEMMMMIMMMMMNSMNRTTVTDRQHQ